MIILEGPDGGGKTTLLAHLQEKHKLRQAPRFSSSVGGPVTKLDDAVLTDLAENWDPSKGVDCMIYDRHPFISEFIYGPIIRGKVKDNLDRRNLLGARAMFDMKALVILCVPPFETAWANVQHDPNNQMPGVMAEYDRIYTAYQRLLRSSAFEPIWYDYTVHSTDYLDTKVAEHRYNWETNR